ncbi:serine hydrolase [Psychrobacter sp. I-STPA6b]|uniref:serine hydrolase n=1 Tax=Psychrobacter sp. I-STPA6b TaxID=2585718 RepID=UPI001D0C96FA|nr:peptidase S11 [Psychrobacter sp. I-STPA6b]
MISSDFTPRQLASIFALCCGAMISTSAVAALTISEPSPSYGTARISMGGADSLSQARTIMYSNNTTGQSSNVATTVRRVDNGYSNINKGNYTNTTYASNYNNIYSSNNHYYDPLSITTGSRGAVVLDLSTNTPIYEKNANVARPIASITKLMTAMVILDGGQSMNEEIIIQSADVAKKYYSNYEKTSGTNLKVGDRLNRAELLLMMLMKSENPAGKALARSYPGGYNAFVRAMNQKAQSLGMTSAFFGDPTGLDVRNVASPNDLVKMVRAAGNYEVIRRFTTTPSYDFFVANYSEGNRRYLARNTNYLVRDAIYPIGISKTGFINEAGRCVVMETMVNNRPSIIVLLGANSSATRWSDAENILNSLALRRTI